MPAIVGQDGLPYPEVHNPVTEHDTKLVIPPATRYAIAVTMPTEGDLVLEMPTRGARRCIGGRERRRIVDLGVVAQHRNRSLAAIGLDAATATRGAARRPTGGATA
ncbi:MAG: hypothetical protein WA863_17845 [Methyloceanibacter sp.]